MTQLHPHEESYPMVTIPAGQVNLRDDRIKKTWTVELDSFCLAAVPVTVALYAAVVHTTDQAVRGSTIPVTNISWYDAIRFCNAWSRTSGLKECYSIADGGEQIHVDREANGYRLPTEAEWQYACLAGTIGYRYGELNEIAWYQGNSGGRAHAVGTKEPNAWGLFDMIGNVWEWCWDQYDPLVYGSYRSFRGGSWAEEARGCGATCRRRSHPTFKIDDLGFRLARTR
ncbi:cytoplasmic protein [Paenibacillus ihbetae]|uniref:Cytoplasmic protein n=1 Tax=Paenibacillus ihbetae TaxID=1870820 RepID=A0A1B2DUK1_9BACL|nr:SUMF1/EgtB/PvdO family nonheme iron enzyme [Paenibacillus ihbetae]ANY71392.1 cytoplasmic protein [Paenibacillus ihbetae]